MPFEEAEARISERLRGLSSILPPSREVFFSGGVDSALLAALLLDQPGTTVGSNLALSDSDSEADHAIAVAGDLGLPLVQTRLTLGTEELVSTIGSYASPTLDFSILPTFSLGRNSLGRDAKLLVDGTGGDAWFGFSALRNRRVWRHIHHLYFVRGAAAQAYSRIAAVADSRALTPLKVIARSPRHGDAALAHLCASPLYDVIWKLPRSRWHEAEMEVGQVLDRLLGGNRQEPWQRMLVADGAFIASAAFAAKSGQWSLVRRQPTVYPFLTPGLVDIARQLTLQQLVEAGEAKPLLKKLAVRAGVPPSRIYRTKSGFQPPLAQLVRQPAVRDYVESLFDDHDEIDEYVSSAGRELVSRMVAGEQRASIHLLYPFWNIVALRIWLRELRSGAAAARWCGPAGH